jgi:alpha-beta hydrolase superfamily lysophospholipase
MGYLINKKKQKIAFKYVKGNSPGIIFIHGLNSDMNGQKALNIKKYAKKKNLSFISFDCRGHGKSSGKFEDFTISDWKEDVLGIVDHIAKGPQILIGSSMGGWLMTLTAKARPERIIGLIGLAAAIDFGKNFYNNLNKKNKNEIKRNGITKISSHGFSYFLKSKFFTEAKKNNILTKPFRYKKPLILIHGLKDDIVSPDMPKKIMNNTSGNNVQIIYLKSSDHRLSKPEDLITINNAIENIRYQI